MNPHDRNGPIDFPRVDYLFGRLFAITMLAVAMFVIGYMAGEQRGYKEGQAINKCKPYNEAKPLTEKQKLKISLWMMRDKGVILK